MVKVLVLGATGMLGNAVFSYLQKQGIDVVGTTRSGGSGLFGFDVKGDSIENDIRTLLKKTQPTYVINCIGYIRPASTQEDNLQSFMINAYLPKVLCNILAEYGIRLIHVSTDCVFDGKKGNYSENDVPNEQGVYGLSKFLGEVTNPPHITIRTSIIGKEFGSQRNLLDWFLSNPRGSNLKGYSHVYRNGITTITLAKIIYKIIDKNLPFKKGLIQIGIPKIDKYSLLILFNEIFNRDFVVTKFDLVESDKSILPSDEQSFFEDIIYPIKEQILELKEFYNL